MRTVFSALTLTLTACGGGVEVVCEREGLTVVASDFMAERYDNSITPEQCESFGAEVARVLGKLIDARTRLLGYRVEVLNVDTFPHPQDFTPVAGTVRCDSRFIRLARPWAGLAHELLHAYEGCYEANLEDTFTAQHFEWPEKGFPAIAGESNDFYYKQRGYTSIKRVP